MIFIQKDISKVREFIVEEWNTYADIPFLLIPDFTPKTKKIKSPLNIIIDYINSGTGRPKHMIKNPEAVTRLNNKKVIADFLYHKHESNIAWSIQRNFKCSACGQSFGKRIGKIYDDIKIMAKLS